MLLLLNWNYCMVWQRAAAANNNDWTYDLYHHLIFISPVDYHKEVKASARLKMNLRQPFTQPSCSPMFAPLDYIQVQQVTQHEFRNCCVFAQRRGSVTELRMTSFTNMGSAVVMQRGMHLCMVSTWKWLVCLPPDWMVQVLGASFIVTAHCWWRLWLIDTDHTHLLCWNVLNV